MSSKSSSRFEQFPSARRVLRNWSATTLRTCRQGLTSLQHLSLDVTRTSENAYGVVYEIEGPITTPTDRTVRFCSVWQVDTGTDVPRFITMYPR